MIHLKTQPIFLGKKRVYWGSSLEAKKWVARIIATQAALSLIKTNLSGKIIDENKADKFMEEWSNNLKKQMSYMPKLTKKVEEILD